MIEEVIYGHEYYEVVRRFHRNGEEVVELYIPVKNNLVVQAKDCKRIPAMVLEAERVPEPVVIQTVAALQEQYERWNGNLDSDFRRAVHEAIHLLSPRVPQKRWPKKGEPKNRATFDHAAAVAMYAAGGVTLQDVADRYGVTRERIRQILRKAGVPKRGVGAPQIHPRQPKPIDGEALAERYVAGETTIALGEAYGCSAGRIGTHLKKAGYTLRPKGSRKKKAG